jgi:hypothetical protein
MHAMMRPVVVASLAAFTLLASCKSKSEEPTPEATCAKIAALEGAMNEAERARCAAGLAARPPEKRACISACASSAKTALDLLDCKEDCTGDAIPIVVTCEKLGTLESDATECTNRYFALQKAQPSIYKCLSRCVRRAEGRTAADACRPACNVPPPARGR